MPRWGSQANEHHGKNRLNDTMTTEHPKGGAESGSREKRENSNFCRRDLLKVGGLTTFGLPLFTKSAKSQQGNELSEVQQEQEGVEFEGRLHRPLGRARLENFGEYLAVENIGSSGEDGVTISLEPEPKDELFMVEWRTDLNERLDPSQSDIFLEFSGRGGIEGILEPTQPLGSMKVMDGTFAVDYRPVEPGAIRIDALENGEIVDRWVLEGDPSLQPGIVASVEEEVPFWPISCGKVFPLPEPPDPFPICIPVRFIDPIPLRIHLGPDERDEVVADELRVVSVDLQLEGAEDVTGDAVTVSQYDIRSAGVPVEIGRESWQSG